MTAGAAAGSVGGMVSMADVVEGRERWLVQHADALFALSCLPDACVDAIVTDPPYGLGGREPAPEEIIAYMLGSAVLNTGGDFMGHRWSIPTVAFWKECLRVLKPGGYLVSFAGPRTLDLMGLGIRCARFEIRDGVAWLQAQGFPKSLDVAKAIDKLNGVAPTVVGYRVLTGSAALSTAEKGGTYASGTSSAGRTKKVPITVPTSEEAKRWDGYGTALKPSFEPCVLARKPLDGTVAANLRAHGTGVLNIDGCRVGPDETASGRWPPNVAFGHAEGCKCSGTKQVAGDPRGEPGGSRPGGFGDVGADSGTGAPNAHVYGDETVDTWECVPGCPVAILDTQSGERPSTLTGRADPSSSHQHPSGALCDSVFGVGGAKADVYADAGTASRFFPQFALDPELDAPFFYCRKTNSAEREMGLDERSIHPTMKPVALMRWLVRLVTPPGGLVLDPFSGSGSTGVGAILEAGGFRFLGVEREPEYVAIADKRMQHVAGGRYRSLAEIAAAAAPGSGTQLGLF